MSGRNRISLFLLCCGGGASREIARWNPPLRASWRPLEARKRHRCSQQLHRREPAPARHEAVPAMLPGVAHVALSSSERRSGGEARALVIGNRPVKSRPSPPVLAARPTRRGTVASGPAWRVSTPWGGAFSLRCRPHLPPLVFSSCAAPPSTPPPIGGAR